MTADPGSEAVLESRRNTGEVLLAATRESLPFLLRGRLRRRAKRSRSERQPSGAPSNSSTPMAGSGLLKR